MTGNSWYRWFPAELTMWIDTLDQTEGISMRRYLIGYAVSRYNYEVKGPPTWRNVVTKDPMYLLGVEDGKGDVDHDYSRNWI